MPRTLVFSDVIAFYDELDSIVQAGQAVRIKFTASPPAEYSDLWKRLGQCTGWEDYILVDYLVAAPEPMYVPELSVLLMIFQLFPVLCKLFKFKRYSSNWLFTQRYQIGDLRRIVIAPKNRYAAKTNSAFDVFLLLRKSKKRASQA